MKKTSITFLKHKTNIEEAIKEIENTDAEYIHVDVMDGKFVNNTFLTNDEASKFLTNTSKPLDVHLMVEKPLEYIKFYSKFNTAYITIHVELNTDLDYLISMIKNYGVKAGLAINPDTSIEALYHYLDEIDYIIIMGVTPGAGGQKLIPETIDKIRELKELRKENNYHYEISLDGGVNDSTRPLLNELDTIIVGSYVSMSDDFQEAINTLR